MTDKQIIKLKPTEDLNEKIIKEKGNTKCIFYSDDICRNGDKTRDCVNCARVKYHSLYSLNWDNQERLQKIIKQKEQECERLKRDYFKQNEWLKEQKKELDQLKAENDTLRQFLSKEPLALQALQSAYSSYKKSADVFYEMIKQYKQTITEIKEIAEEEIECKIYEIENDCFNKTRCKALNEHIDFTKQILQKISECEVENGN